MLDSFRQKQRWCDKVTKYFSVTLWLKRAVPKSTVIIIAVTLATQIFLPKWHTDNLAMLKSSISSSLAPSWLHRATSPGNCAVPSVSVYLSSKQGQISTLYLCCYLSSVRLKEPVHLSSVWAFQGGVCVTHWSTALSICAMESLSVQITFPNCSLGTQWNKWVHAVWRDGNYVSSKQWVNCCDVIRFF